MKRHVWTWVFAAFGPALVVVLLLGWYGWKRTVPVSSDATLNGETFHLGDEIRVTVSVRLPWRQRPAEALGLDVPEGLDRLGDERRLGGVGLGTWRWEVTCRLQAYDFGPFETLTVTLPLEGEGQPAMVTEVLPAIKVEPRIQGREAEPTSAGILSESFLRQYRHWPAWMWWPLGGIVIVLALLAVYIVRHWRDAVQEQQPDPWEVAEAALDELEARLPMAADAFFLALTDLVRRYIEAAFSLRATEQTTPEFLLALKRPGGRLDTAQRLVLTDLLTMADVIKFARGDATEAQMRDALDKARQLVGETRERLIAERRGESSDADVAGAVPAETGEQA